jgi:hypothetical protein
MRRRHRFTSLNGDAREPLRNDIPELQTTLQQAKALRTDMQVMVRANDYNCASARLGKPLGFRNSISWRTAATEGHSAR